MRSSMLIITLACLTGVALAGNPKQAAPAQLSARPAFIGLLEYPAIYSDFAVPDAAVDVRQRASAASLVVATLDRSGIRLARAETHSCTWARDLDTGSAPFACVFSETGYEVPGIAVLEKSQDWYRIALDSKGSHTGWIQSKAAYHSLVELIASPDHLTFLDQSWDGRLYRQPGKLPRQVLPQKTAEQATTVPYRALDHAVLGGRLWIKVEVLDEICGANEPRVLHTGWVPALSPSGRLWAWFHSRGC